MTALSCSAWRCSAPHPTLDRVKLMHLLGPNLDSMGKQALRFLDCGWQQSNSGRGNQELSICRQAVSKKFDIKTFKSVKMFRETNACAIHATP